MLQITPSTSPNKISDYIAKLREEKGSEGKVLEVVKKATIFGNDFVVNLFWEKALTYQHLVMNEDAKGENADKNARSQHLLKMEEAVKHAGYFIVRFDQERWKSRLYRFLGRVCDYKRDYKRAISYYRKSLKFARMDPDYLGLRYPRWLEVEAFISYSMIMSGQTNNGRTQAEFLFKKFDEDKDALYLKKTDYVTWAIWKSGISIRTINALLDKKVAFDKKRANDWLLDSEKLLNSSKKAKFWADFSYRKKEIEAVRKRLSESSN